MTTDRDEPTKREIGAALAGLCRGSGERLDDWGKWLFRGLEPKPLRPTPQEIAEQERSAATARAEESRQAERRAREEESRREARENSTRKLAEIDAMRKEARRIRENIDAFAAGFSARGRR